MSTFIVSSCCFVAVVKKFAAGASEKQKYLPWYFFLKLWNLLYFKISKHDVSIKQLNLKKNHLELKRYVPLDQGCAFTYE